MMESQKQRKNFNPRSPHGERLTEMMRKCRKTRFQSTLPAWGATRIQSDFCKRRVISIHAPRMGSDRIRCFCPCTHAISIHAPRMGSDVKGRYKKNPGQFQSTLPAWGATNHSARFVRAREISIHAPRMGSDKRHHISLVHKHNFNPRSPHGERQRKVTILSIRIIDFAQKVYHKTVLLRISLAENAVILPEKPRNPVRTSLQKAGGLRFARAIRAARPYSISSPSGA